MVRDDVSPYAAKAMTPSAIKTMTAAIGRYIDQNSTVLMALDMSERYSFGDSDRQVVYTCLGVTGDFMDESIQRAKQICKSNKIQSNSFYCATILAMHFLLAKKMEKEARILMVYMSLMMYTSMHKGFYKYGANKEIMAYTLAHLDKAYSIRQFPSLFAYLENNASVTFETYQDRLKRADDTDLTWVANALWDRLKGKLRKISNAYYTNHASGNYLNSDSDSYTEDDFHEADNNSFMIDRLANKIYIKLLNHQYDDRLLKYAITRSDTSLIKLKNLVDDIIDTDTNMNLKRFLSQSIEYYLLNSGRGFESIGRGEYITYMKSGYASNANIQQLINMKAQLDTWVTENMVSIGRARYGKTAMLSYKKALYMFFVFETNYEAKI